MRYKTSTIIKQKSSKFAKNPCNYCGDGVLADSENCGEATLYNRYGASPTSTSGTQKAKGAAEFTVSNGYKYYINIPGVYCFIAKGGDGGAGTSGSNGCGGATVASCYKLQKDDLVTFRVGNAGGKGPLDDNDSCDDFYGGGNGGGASWVYLTRGSTDVLLLVAGGGGGGGWHGDKNYCGGGSSSTSANSYTNTDGKTGACSKDPASDGTTIDTSNFATLTVANGGDGGYQSVLSGCNDKNCDHSYACGGGGGGYVGGSKGPYDVGGSGGGSYVNTSFTSYDTSYATSTMVAGSKGNISSPSAGSIKVSNPKCLTCTECKYTTTYGACN